jgi:hypothetical protein
MTISEAVLRQHSLQFSAALTGVFFNMAGGAVSRYLVI